MTLWRGSGTGFLRNRKRSVRWCPRRCGRGSIPRATKSSVDRQRRDEQFLRPLRLHLQFIRWWKIAGHGDQIPAAQHLEDQRARRALADLLHIPQVERSAACLFCQILEQGTAVARYIGG